MAPRVVLHRPSLFLSITPWALPPSVLFLVTPVCFIYVLLFFTCVYFCVYVHPAELAHTGPSHGLRFRTWAGDAPGVRNRVHHRRLRQRHPRKLGSELARRRHCEGDNKSNRVSVLFNAHLRVWRHMYFVVLVAQS